jgi:hypothetical protein
MGYGSHRLLTHSDIATTEIALYLWNISFLYDFNGLHFHYGQFFVFRDQNVLVWIKWITFVFTKAIFLYLGSRILWHESNGMHLRFYCGHTLCLGNKMLLRVKWNSLTIWLEPFSCTWIAEFCGTNQTDHFTFSLDDHELQKRILWHPLHNLDTDKVLKSPPVASIRWNIVPFNTPILLRIWNIILWHPLNGWLNSSKSNTNIKNNINFHVLINPALLNAPHVCPCLY